MLRLLKSQTSPAWAILVMVVVTVAVVGASVVASPLAACHEVLDEAALSEIVPVGGVELAPFVAVPTKRSRLPVATRGVSSGRLAWAPL